MARKSTQGRGRIMRRQRDPTHEGVGADRRPSGAVANSAAGSGPWLENAPFIWGRLDRSASCPSLDGLTSDGDGPLFGFNEFLAGRLGAASARVVVAGSSCINLMVHGFVVPRLLAGGRTALLLDRDAHLSVIGALSMSGQEVVWLERRYDARNDVHVPFTVEQVRDALDRHPEVGVVGLTSPTYDGFDAPIEGISALCRGRGILLVVDAAWGPGHGLLSHVGFPPSAVQRGADIAGTSLHKKGLAPSQVAVASFRFAEHAALMDVCGNLGFQTTSPNYVMLGGAESMVHHALDDRLAPGWLAVRAAAETLADRIGEAHPDFRVIRPTDVGASSGDPGHVLVHVGRSGLTGFELQAALARRGFDAEKATMDTLLLLVGPYEATRMDVWLEIIAGATRDALGSRDHRDRRDDDLRIPGRRRERVLSIREAVYAGSSWVPLPLAPGRVSAGVIAVYPPGTALVVPGERIEKQHVEYLAAVRGCGGRVKGIAPGTGCVSVVSPDA